MPIAGHAVVQSCGRSRRHSSHSPHDGAHESATWSPGADTRHAGADGLDDARALVAEHRRARRLRRPVDRVLVGVADAADACSRTSTSPSRGSREVELGDVLAAPGLLEDRGADLQAGTALSPV